MFLVKVKSKLLKIALSKLLTISELMGGSLPLAYYNALQEERGEPGPGAGAECVTSEPVPRVVTTRLYGWCLPRRMEGCQENKVLTMNIFFLVLLSTFT